MKGKDVRKMIHENGVSLWEVAEKFGCTPQWFSVRLRHDFTDAEVERVRAIIEELKKPA